MITAERLYDQNPDTKYFYQGDVIRDVPYPFWPTLNSAKEQTKWGVLRPHKMEGRTVRDVLKSLPTLVLGRAARDVTDLWTADNREYVVAGCMKLNVMIITRGCTLDNPNRKHFAAVPVVAVEDLAENQRTPAAIERGRIAPPVTNSPPKSIESTMKVRKAIAG